jgi:hypothetical protein
MNLTEIRDHGINWTNLAKDRDMCRALVNVVINFQVPQYPN